jgi:hypothetical protein
VEDLQKLDSVLASADFLFGIEIPTYIDQVYRHGFQLRSANANQKRNEQTGQFDERIGDEIVGHLKWFSDQYLIAREKFRKYLDISG